MIDDEPSRLVRARVELHHAVQLAAAVGRSLAASLPDDSHTSLDWNGGVRGFVGHEVGGPGSWRAGLLPDDLALVVLVEGQVAHRLDLAGRTKSAAQAWLGEIAIALGAPQGRLAFDAPYTMPDHTLDAGGRFTLPADGSLKELSRWFADADALLRDKTAKWPGAAPVRVWPHHFDIGSVLPLGADGGEAAPSIGIGLSPGDDGIPEPYFYVTPWPPPAAGEDLPELTPPGRWHRAGWTGAVLIGSDVVAAGDAAAQKARAAEFLAQAVSALCLRHEQRS